MFHKCKPRQVFFRCLAILNYNTKIYQSQSKSGQGEHFSWTCQSDLLFLLFQGIRLCSWIPALLAKYLTFFWLFLSIIRLLTFCWHDSGFLLPVSSSWERTLAHLGPDARIHTKHMACDNLTTWFPHQLAATAPLPLLVSRPCHLLCPLFLGLWIRQPPKLRGLPYSRPGSPQLWLPCRLALLLSQARGMQLRKPHTLVTTAVVVASPGRAGKC